MERNSQIKEVVCKGRKETGRSCNEIIYESDGCFLYGRTANGKLTILNEKLDAQSVRCLNCGYNMSWKRAERFRRSKI